MRRHRRATLASPVSSVRTWILVCIGLARLVAPELTHAQEGLDPASMGMARSGLALTRGIGTLTSNPGAIDFDVDAPGTVRHRLTVAPYTFGGTLGSTYLSSDEFRDIFGPRPAGLTDEDRQRLGDLLQDKRLFANGGVSLLQARLQSESGLSFGLHYGHRVFARVNFPDSFALLVRTGNIIGAYRFLNRGVGGSWLTQLGLSLGTSTTSDGGTWFTATGVGATVKIIRGVANFSIDEHSALSIQPVEAQGAAGFNVRGGYVFRSAQPDNFDLNDAVATFRSGLFPGVAGFGVGFDVGIAGVLYRPRSQDGAPGRDAVTYGIVLQDVGTINWSDNTYERTLKDVNDTLRTSTVNNEQFRRYSGTLAPVGDYSTALPSVLRVGLGFDLNALSGASPESAVRIGVEGEVPLNDEPGNPEHPRLATGVEWAATDWLVLRGGASVGGIGELALGLGLGIRPLNWVAFDIGSGEASELFGGDRLDLSLRLSLGVDALLR